MEFSGGFLLFVFFLFTDKVVSDGAGFACGRPSFLLAPKKEGKKCASGLPP